LIPLIGRNKFMGAMKVMRANKNIKPEISPGIQGSRAYELLSQEQKGMLKHALANAAEYYECKVFELQWAFGKGGALQIRKRKIIDIRTGKSN